MKEDDSRRISFLAERLLSEFEQTRMPGKVIPSKPSIEVEPATADLLNNDPLAAPKMEEIQVAREIQTPQPIVEKINRPIENASAATKLVFDRSFWLKWIGTVILAIVSSIALQKYHSTTDSLGAVRVLFGAVAALTSLVQWFFFRSRLEFWWVSVNAVTGIGLGVLNKTLSDTIGADELLILLAIWIVLNFIVGLMLLRGTQEKPRGSSSIIETGARQNIFLMLLSVSLIVGATLSASVIFDNSDYRQILGILYGISAVLVGVAFLRKKEIPRNFGFITLVIFLLFDGINVARSVSLSEYPSYYFTLNGITALAAGVFFISQREVWKNFGFLMASGSLLMTGLSGLVIYNTDLYIILLAAFILFAIPAAIFFILRK